MEQGVLLLASSCKCALKQSQLKVMSGRSTEHAGVILFGANKTRTSLAEVTQGYEWVREIVPLDSADRSMVDVLRSKAEISENEGDSHTAIIVALQMIRTGKATKRWTKDIVLVTDGATPCDWDGLKDTCDQLNMDGVALTVV